VSLSANYSAGKSFIEGFMIDTCVVTRDYQQTKDDTLPEMSMTIVRPANDTVTVYTGKCLVRSNRSLGNTIEGGLELDEPDFKILLPLDAPLVRLNDRLTVTNSVNDSTLETKLIRIVNVDASSHRVYREVWGRDETIFSPGE
jgi:hypothetical protein